jgi:hypothetical protein
MLPRACQAIVELSPVGANQATQFIVAFYLIPSEQSVPLFFL